MLKCINDFGVRLTKEKKKHLETTSVFYWLNSQQFIWNSNHTSRLSEIVDIKDIACHLQEEEENDMISGKEFSSPLTPPSPSRPTLSLVLKPPSPSLGHLPTPHTPPHPFPPQKGPPPPRGASFRPGPPPPPPLLFVFRNVYGARQIEMDSLFTLSREFRKFQFTPMKDDQKNDISKR